MLKLLEIFRLIRFVNCLLASVGVAIGAWMTALVPTYYGPMVAAVAAFLVCAAGNIVNDIVDVEIDRISHPRRVLVRRALTPNFARNLAVGFNVVALIMALCVSWAVTLVALITILLLLAYNLRLKRTPFLGNVAVAAMAGLTFVTGGLAVDPDLAFRLPGPLIPAVFAFFFHLVREVVKDVQDLDGDSSARVCTLPQIVGTGKSLLLALALFVVLTLLTLVPVVAGWFGKTYQVITVYVVDLPLLVVLILIWGNPTPRMLQIGSTGLKAGMILGMLALVLA